MSGDNIVRKKWNADHAVWTQVTLEKCKNSWQCALFRAGSWRLAVGKYEQDEYSVAGSWPINQ